LSKWADRYIITLAMPNNVTEEIKQKIDLADLIGEYLKLTPAGTNLRGLCPFHNEKTPSFMVNGEKQIWHCFGCGLGGDHFSFVQKMEGVEFPEALRMLANRSGVKLETYKPDEQNQHSRLLDLCLLAAKHWRQLLLEDNEAGIARDYLKKRGVTMQTSEDFLLGYSKESWDDFIQFALKRGFSLKEITDAGLSVVGQNNKPHDRFRARLMFPLRDVHGNVVGFTSRKLKEDDFGGKYINSPQTPIYNKSKLLYNLNLAKTEIKRLDYAILVEGNMDAISVYQSGTKNVIAVSGTALTLDQLTLLKRYTTSVMIAFDADSAGERANLRGVDLAWTLGFNVKVIVMPVGEDPDSVASKSADVWRNLIKKSYPLMDYVFEATGNGLDLKRVDHKKKFTAKLLPLIVKMGNEVEKSHYLKKLSDTIGIAESVIVKLATDIKRSVKPTEVKPATTTTIVPDRERAIAENFLTLIVKFPNLLKNNVIANISTLGYPATQNLYVKLISCYNKNCNLTENFLKQELLPDEFSYFSELSMLAEEQFGELTEKSAEAEGLRIIKEWQIKRLKEQMNLLGKEMATAEKAGNEILAKELAEKFSKLATELNSLTSD